MLNISQDYSLNSHTNYTKIYLQQHIYACTHHYISYIAAISCINTSLSFIRGNVFAPLIAQNEEPFPLRVRTITRRVPLDTLIYFVPVRLDIQLIIKRLVNMIQNVNPTVMSRSLLIIISSIPFVVYRFFQHNYRFLKQKLTISVKISLFCFVR